MKGLRSNGIEKYFLNEETAVEDFERKVYRVESVQPWGHSLAQSLGAGSRQEVQCLGSQSRNAEPEPFIQGLIET